jgi:hypothetical protein
MPQKQPRLVPLSQTTQPNVPQRKDQIAAADDDDDDDGGIDPKKIAKRKQELAEKKKKKKKESIATQSLLDDDDDDDGGIKPKSISTISKIMPQKQPHLSLLQQSLPPKVPQRQDRMSDDDDDDDGGIDPKKIAKRKQELAEKKKQKDEAKKKKQSIVAQDLLDEDDDGGISKKKQEADIKKTKKPDDTKPKKKLPTKQDLDDEDDDDGIIKAKQLAAEKKKQELEAKKKKAQLIKAKLEEDDDDDEPIIKTYDTVRMVMPSKQPLLNNQTKKEASPEATDDGGLLTSRHQQPTPASYDTVGRMVPKVSTDFPNIKSKKRSEENHYDTIPTDEDRTARMNAIYSPPPYDQVSNPTDLDLLRTTSYREAQHRTPPLTNRRPVGSSSIRSQSNTNEDSSHYSEITNDTVQSGVINRSYSHTGSIQSSSNHSIKQPSKHSSKQPLKEDEQTEESIIETEEESEEEEEEQELVQDKPLQNKRISTSNTSTAYSTIGHLVKPEEARALTDIRKKKQARFRWFLAYTIINNYHLFDLRKQAQSRLALLRIQRSNLIDEEKYAATVAIEESVPITDTPKSSKSKQKKMGYVNLKQI